MYILKLSYRGSDGIYHEGGFFSGFGMAYRPEYEILEPNLETVVNSVGHFSFTVYPSHPLYEYIDQPKALLEVVRYGVDEPLFVGRMAECTKGLYNEKMLTFESELSYLLDSIRTNFNSVAGYGCEYWLSEILEYHNSHAGNFGSVYTENIQRKFRCGKVSDSIRVRCTNIPPETFKGSFSTLEIIRKLLLERYGGVLKIRHVGGVNYVDWLEENDLHVCSQRIELASNLLNIENSITTDEIVTAIRPVGEITAQGGESVPLEISLTDVSGYINDEGIFQVMDDTVSDSSALHFTDTLYSQSLVNRYGWICREVFFEGVTSVADLTKKAVNYLKASGQKQSIVLNALDLSAVGNSIENFLAGDMAVVNSPVHSFYDRKMMITSVTLNLSDPGAGEIVLGNQAESITSQVGRGAVTGSYTGGYTGGGGSSTEELRAVLEEAKKYTDSSLENKVDKEEGKSLSTNDFTDEYKSQIDTNTSDIDNLKSRADAVDVNVSDLSDKVEQNTADTEQLKSKTDATDDVVAHLSESLQNAVFKSNVDTELNASSENPVQNKAVTLRVEGIDAQVTQLQSKVSDNIADIKTNSDNISALDNKAVSAETEINSLKSKTDATDEVVAHLSESLQNAVFKSNVDTALSTSSANPVQNRAVTLRVEGLNSQVTQLQGKVEELEDDVGVQKATNTELVSRTQANAGEIGILKGTLGFEGKNKFNNTTSSTTVSGVTFTVNSDGTITANGTATANISFQLKPNLYIQNNGWAGNIFSFGAIETNKNYRGLLMYYNSNWTLQNSVYLNSTEAPLLDYYCAIACIYVVKGTTLNEVLFEPMLRDGNIEDDTYSSYGGLNVIKRFEKFSDQKLLYSKTTSSASPLTVNVSNLFTGYSAAVCNVVTTGDKYSIILPLQYIKSLGTSVNYEADDLLFTYVDNSNIQIRTGLASSNPTINSVNIIGLY